MANHKRRPPGDVARAAKAAATQTDGVDAERLRAVGASLRVGPDTWLALLASGVNGVVRDWAQRCYADLAASEDGALVASLSAAEIRDPCGDVCYGILAPDQDTPTVAAVLRASVDTGVVETWGPSGWVLTQPEDEPTGLNYVELSGELLADALTATAGGGALILHPGNPRGWLMRGSKSALAASVTGDGVFAVTDDLDPAAVLDVFTVNPPATRWDAGWRPDPDGVAYLLASGMPILTVPPVEVATLLREVDDHNLVHGNTTDALTAAGDGGPTVAGLAVHADDTGRVLMLQRALTDDDPAAGTWEFPGGHLEGGETPLDGAAREWCEETGCDLPPGEPGGTWTSPDGVYQGTVYHIPSEDMVDLHDGRDEVINPDDPDGDQTESVAWWDPEHLDGNPGLRPELAGQTGQVLDAVDEGTEGPGEDDALTADAGDPLDTTPDFSDGVMVALPVDEDTANELAVPGGLAPDDMHVTLAYLGSQDTCPVDMDTLCRIVSEFAESRPAFEGEIAGPGMFQGSDNADNPVHVGLVDAPALPSLRQGLVDWLHHHVVPVVSNHGYTPHVTRTYGDTPPDDQTPIGGLPLRFGSVSVHHGTDRQDFPLAGGLVAAFDPSEMRDLTGKWSASGGGKKPGGKHVPVAANKRTPDHVTGITGKPGAKFEGYVTDKQGRIIGVEEDTPHPPGGGGGGKSGKGGKGRHRKTASKHPTRIQRLGRASQQMHMRIAARSGGTSGQGTLKADVGALVASGVVYHWRHGWIPLTHAAALAKAKGNHKLAAKYVKPPRKTPQHILDYHAERHAQNKRFEEHTGGGISADDTHTQEYKDYFGVGDHSTGGKREDRYTFGEHMKRLSAGKADEAAHNESYKTGFKLGRAHHAAKLDTAAENASYDKHASTVPHPDTFDQGYSEGLAAAYDRAHRAKLRRQARRAKVASAWVLTADAVAHTRTPRQLETYWTKGRGAAKIAWGAPHDYYRCLAELGKYVHDPHKVKGQCANLHKIALGVWPGREHGGGSGKGEAAGLTAAGPHPRHPYPGQHYKHGWIPVAGGHAESIRRDVKKYRDDHAAHVKHFDAGARDRHRGGVDEAARAKQIEAEHGPEAAHAYKQGSYMQQQQQYANEDAVKPPTKREQAARAEHVQQSVQSFAVKAKPIAESLIGGHSGFTGKVVIYPQSEMPGAAAYMGWDGTMGVEQSHAERLTDLLEGKGSDYTTAENILHELVHSIGQQPEHHSYSALAYRDKNKAMIEEGFTELAAAQHFPEWSRKLGFGNNTTRFVAEHHEGHATVAEYGERLAGRAGTAATAWGHYDEQVQQALAWAREIAHLEGRRRGKALQDRVQALSDEVNREAAAYKVGALATQVLRVAGLHPDTSISPHSQDYEGQTLYGKLVALIEQQWLWDSEYRYTPTKLAEIAKEIAR